MSRENPFEGMNKADIHEAVQEVAYEAVSKGEYRTVAEAAADIWEGDPELYDSYVAAPVAPVDDLGPAVVEKRISHDPTGRDLADMALTALAKSMRESMNPNNPASWTTTPEEFYFKAASTPEGTVLWNFMSSDPLAREPVSELRSRVRKDGHNNRLGDVFDIADRALRFR